MELSAWNDGANTYGIRAGIKNRNQYFDRGWTEIEAEIDGQFRRFALRRYWSLDHILKTRPAIHGGPFAASDTISGHDTRGLLKQPLQPTHKAAARLRR